ncbi:MAG: hypothetical protein JSS94_01675 [Bacteroidetes bacterium]|nr:hypothetical protein [Bacteroidota bacterium]
MKLKPLFFCVFLMCFLHLNAQEVFLRTMKDIQKEHKDSFLYALDSATADAQFLGELEVIGLGTDTQKSFVAIYNKAKEIGANTYVVRRFENIDGSFQDFDPTHFKLNLYYTPADKITQHPNRVFVISSSDKPQKIRLNDDLLEINPQHYLLRTLQPGQSLKIATRKILGSSIHHTADAKQASYYQVFGFSMKKGTYGSEGLLFKTGDVQKLDASYGQFLVTIFQNQP